MQIYRNQPDHFDAFIRLNEAWIGRFFTLESADRELAKDPAKIIRQGGFIFSLVPEDSPQTVAGACALIHTDGAGQRYELARMAVDPNYQGLGYGHGLMKAALATLQSIGAQEVFLLSNSRLTAALALYKKHGFVKAGSGADTGYSRCDVIMSRPVQPTPETTSPK